MIVCVSKKQLNEEQQSTEGGCVRSHPNTSWEAGEIVGSVREGKGDVGEG